VKPAPPDGAAVPRLTHTGEGLASAALMAGGGPRPASRSSKPRADGNWRFAPKALRCRAPCGSPRAGTPDSSTRRGPVFTRPRRNRSCDARALAISIAIIAFAF